MFTQITTLIGFTVGILFLVFLIIYILRWFLRRSIKIRATSYEDQNYNYKTLIDIPADGINSIGFSDEWNLKNYKESLNGLKLYYNSRQANILSEKENTNIDISRELLKTHLDKILTYIKNRLLYLRENYGKKIIQENYIFDTIKNFGILEEDLITGYQSIIYAIDIIYGRKFEDSNQEFRDYDRKFEDFNQNPEDSNQKFEEKTEVKRLFSGAGEFFKYKKLLEIINFEVQEDGIQEDVIMRDEVREKEMQKVEFQENEINGDRIQGNEDQDIEI